jgi:hypothetical protein
VASDGAHNSAYGGTNSGGSGQGVGGAHGWASGGTHAGYDEGSIDQRVGHSGDAHGDACRGASGYNRTHGVLTGGGGGSLKGGDGHSQGGWSDNSNG